VHGFSNCGPRNTAGVPPIIYWHAAAIRKSKYKNHKTFKNKYNKKNIFANMQHCWQHRISHQRCQPVFPTSTPFFKYKNIGGTLQLLKFFFVMG
jgi:hypothetical protein